MARCLPHGETATVNRRHLLIDTDIGTDVDDALLLLQVIGRRGIEEYSLMMSYGDVNLRAKIAKNYLNLAKADAPIIFGESTTLSGKEAWTSKLEGSLHGNLQEIELPSNGWSEYLCTLASNPELEIEILAISPLTTIASALSKYPVLKNKIKHMFIMGGRFEEGKAEHNILSDITAAQIVFSSPIQISVIGIEQTSKLKMNCDLFALPENKSPALNRLYEEIIQWAEFWERDWIVPHDSLAYLMSSNPEFFEFSEPGQITVKEDGSTYFMNNSLGLHRYVTGFDIDKAKNAILKAIEGV